MLTIPSSEFASNIGKHNVDVQREPIQVTSYGRPVAYYVSPQEFDELAKIREARKRVYNLATLPNEEWDAIINAAPEDDAIAPKSTRRRVYQPGDTDYPAVEGEE